jgi:hypothetical protein
LNVGKGPAFDSETARMKQLSLLLCLLSLLLPARAERDQKAGQVEIVVLSQEVGPTSSPHSDLVHFKVKLTNRGDSPVVYGNNRFILRDSEAGHHLVNRGWYPQRDRLDPGESVELDRIYFEIPKGSKPAELVLMWRRFVVGTVKLKS